MSTVWLGKTISYCLAEPVSQYISFKSNKLGKTIILSYRAYLLMRPFICKTILIVLQTRDLSASLNLGKTILNCLTETKLVFVLLACIYLSQDNSSKTISFVLPVAFIFFITNIHTIHTLIRPRFSSFRDKNLLGFVFQAFVACCVTRLSLNRVEALPKLNWVYVFLRDSIVLVDLILGLIDLLNHIPVFGC